MKVAAIIPVKTFSKAKTRLGLTEEKTEELCKIMLDEVLRATTKSMINKTILISKDEDAIQIGKRHDVEAVFEHKENGDTNYKKYEINPHNVL